jgi:tellurite resistance protein TerC
MHSVGEWWMWLSLIILIVVMLALDWFILNGKKPRKITNREALSWVMAWITLAFLFNLFLWYYLKQTEPAIANDTGLKFFTGYLVEKSLSIDNMFIFIMIFSHFKVPPEYQRRVLLFGILGAIIMRLIMIFLGVFLLSKFHWILYLFGSFLVFTGIKMLFFQDNQPDFQKSKLILWMKKHLRMTDSFHGEKFLIKRDKKIYFTPLLLVLLLIEASDLIFAFDSVPAIFAITEDPFIIFASNIFAILGLRALYFLIANMVQRFHLLKYGLAIILAFIGCKILVAPWLMIPTLAALAFVALTLICSVSLSLIARKN